MLTTTAMMIWAPDLPYHWGSLPFWPYRVMTVHSPALPGENGFQSLLLFSHSVMFDSLEPHGLQHAGIPCPPLSPRVWPNSCPLSQWGHQITSSSVVLLSFCPQSFPETWSFLMSQLFQSDGQRIGASASAPVLPINIQDWFPLGLTGLSFLQSKGLIRVFSNTTVQKHQLFSAQLSL